ncbi:tyrosine-type recombinase/integrase [Bacillus pseudomycoides]|uniref:Tyrosine-type recombinase/integrase n=1 Tax=Bacillus pseudomycoides TaxID=64104 RepID=A0AAJ2DQH2_9BACI|nr:tyrosine-type recombinase/integrase [Bacillus pseudomycoides]MDR4329322.1 tyrosine-type recombinase/integrase [Bacillus pseudomycoides]MED1534547.1 tyrosine-type recombinase/integrase [Bacillus pseudomycoides]PFZ82160.1 integrase [Bacillus pseudomycoides]PHD08485.1 integrase [Bacillus pseudomycoides]
MKFKINTLHKDSSLEIIGKQKHEFANIIAIWNEDILKQAEQRKENNEREDKQTYDGFSDEEILYYYLNRQTHFDKEKRIKDNSRVLYARDLSQFYFFIKQSTEYLQQDVKDYEDGRVWRNLRKRHIRNYQRWLSEEAVSYQSKEKYKPSTISRKLGVIRSYLKWLYEIGYIQEPLHVEVLSTTVGKHHKPKRDLSYEEVKQLLRYYQDNEINYALLSILATTGLRVAEVAHAKWENLEFDSIRDRYYLTVDTKGNGERIVSINKEIFNRIVAFRIRRRLPINIGNKNGGTIFQTKNHTAYRENYLSQYITKIIKDTELSFTKDIRITPHFFRHFYVQYLYDYKELPPHLIAAAVGHKDDRTTKENYLKQRLIKDKDAGNLIGEDEF